MRRAIFFQGIHVRLLTSIFGELRLGVSNGKLITVSTETESLDKTIHITSMPHLNQKHPSSKPSFTHNSHPHSLFHISIARTVLQHLPSYLQKESYQKDVQYYCKQNKKYEICQSFTHTDPKLIHF